MTESYEQQSVIRAFCVGGCGRELEPDEIYACGNCLSEWLIYRDPDHAMGEENYGEPAERS